MINTKELRRLTQAATPGPWKMLPVGDGRQKFAVADSEFHSILTVTDEGDATFGTVYDDADAELIAAANPAAISELLDRLEAAEKERDAYKSAYADWTAKTEWLQDEINSGKLPAKYLGMHRADGIKVEIDALRAKIEQMEKQEPHYLFRRTGEALIRLSDAIAAVEYNFAQVAPIEQDTSMRKAWARFSNELHRGPPAPREIDEAINAAIEMVERLELAESSVAWHRRRWMALQMHKTKMREPERTMVCDILAHGELTHPTVSGDRYAIKDAMEESK